LGTDGPRNKIFDIILWMQSHQKRYSKIKHIIKWVTVGNVQIYWEKKYLKGIWGLIYTNKFANMCIRVWIPLHWDWALLTHTSNFSISMTILTILVLLGLKYWQFWKAHQSSSDMINQKLDWHAHHARLHRERLDLHLGAHPWAVLVFSSTRLV